jgi:hypothetical protein
MLYFGTTLFKLRKIPTMLAQFVTNHELFEIMYQDNDTSSKMTIRNSFLCLLMRWITSLYSSYGNFPLFSDFHLSQWKDIFGLLKEKCEHRSVWSVKISFKIESKIDIFWQTEFGKFFFPQLASSIGKVKGNSSGWTKIVLGVRSCKGKKSPERANV